MKEFEEYINGHLPDKCDYAIIIDESNHPKLHPVSDPEDLVMLKLRSNIYSVKTYDELYKMCLKTFSFARTIEGETYTIGSVDPIATMLSMIELKLSTNLNSFVAINPKVRQAYPKAITEVVTGIQPIFTNTYIKKRP